jgi:hypothetical protein
MGFLSSAVDPPVARKLVLVDVVSEKCGEQAEENRALQKSSLRLNIPAASESINCIIGPAEFVALILIREGVLN